MKKFLLAALMAGAASSALAADLPTHKAPPPPAPVYAPPPFTWTGFYIGVNGGFGFSSTGPSSFGHIDGGLVGGTAGYNYQIGQFVVGAEGDFGWDGATASRGFTGPAYTKTRLTDLMTIRGRVGYATDRALLFATGGYAGGSINAKLIDAALPVGSQYYTADSWHSGYTVGAGIEYAFTNTISAKAEYLYTDLGSTTMFAPPHLASAGLHQNIVRAGVNYHF